LAKIQDGDATGNGILPPFDEKNVKQSIPSLHIHRDVVSGGNKNMAPSRGFGFVEFQHHAHALACLRELNNNPSYSKEYAIGGKQVALMKERRKRNNSGKKRKTEPSVNDGGSKIIDENFVTADGNIRTPRLIVEFTVENKAKAKQQAEHKAKQQANQIKQRMESKSDGTAAAAATPPQPKIKKSRGAIQREKKRQRQNNPQEQDNDDCKHDDANPVAQGTVVSKSDESTLLSSNSKKKARVVAPPKKPAKLDVEELTFSNLVASYQQQATSTAGTTDTVIGSSSADNMSKPKRRWYE
jgi:nucleolar protein 4